MRQAINLYRNDAALAQGPPSEMDENEAKVRLDELLDEMEGFALGEGQGGEGREAEVMMDEGEEVIHGAPY